MRLTAFLAAERYDGVFSFSITVPSIECKNKSDTSHLRYVLMAR